MNRFLYGEVNLMAKSLLRGGVYLAISAIVIFLLRDSLWDVLSSADQISEVPIWAWVLMGLFESLSFFCIWWLFKLVLPDVSLRTIAKSQLISNASSRVIPGGAATGGAVQYRVLTGAGVEPSAAVGSLAATSILTFMGLFSIPALAGLVAVVSAPLEQDLAWGAVGGLILLAGTALLGVALTKYDRPLMLLNSAADSVALKLSKVFRFNWEKKPLRFVEERNRIVASLEGRWLAVGIGSIGKWIADFAVLYVAVIAISGDIGFEFPLLLLAYAGASVLVTIPVTPGGFGVVEVGLASLLMSAGVLDDPALLAVFAYRLLSFWFPILIGVVALLFGNSKYLSDRGPAEA